MWMCRYEEQLEKFCKLMDFVIDSAPPELRQDFHTSMVDRMKDRVDKSAFWGNLLRHVMQQGQKNMVWVLSTDLLSMLMIRTIYTQCNVCKFSSTLSKKIKLWFAGNSLTSSFRRHRKSWTAGLRSKAYFHMFLDTSVHHVKQLCDCFIAIDSLHLIFLYLWTTRLLIECYLLQSEVWRRLLQLMQW